MGDLFDSAVYEYGLDYAQFISCFLGSTACHELEQGNPGFLVGKSGTEIAYEMILEVTGEKRVPEIKVQYGRSPEYWCGWAVGYYQWFTSKWYREIFAAVTLEEMLSLYPALHEADVTKFAEVLDARIRERFPETKLKRIRTAYGCSQKELADLSGVSLRSIQMYEQRNKDINRAQAESLYRMAKALGCQMEDLLEK